MMIINNKGRFRWDLQFIHLMFSGISGVDYIRKKYTCNTMKMYSYSLRKVGKIMHWISPPPHGPYMHPL